MKLEPELEPAVDQSDLLVKAYFERLGYEVDWDYKQRTGEHWYEILKNKNLVIQIDNGIPLEAIIEDLLCFADSKPGTSKFDYRINAPDNKVVRELLQKVKEFEGQLTQG